MRLIFLLAFICFFGLVSKGQSNASIYSFKIDSIQGTKKIDFAAFQGKKILIVNTASRDSSFNQYNELKQLYQLYKERLVIIVIPSNSFNSEPATNQQLTPVYTQAFIYQFPVAAKMNVTNPNIHALYKWLTRQTDNGLTNSEVKKSCYKYLIGTDGKLIASFNHMIRPMSPIIRGAIER